MFRGIRLMATAALLLGLALLAGRGTQAGGEVASVIVELKEEPAAVWAARARQAGGAPSDAEVQAYRDSLRAGQDAFLRELAASGVAAQLRSREVKGYDGAVAATAELRYTLVFNGLALAVPASAVESVEAMPQVKKVHPNTMFFTELRRSVDYINAPKVYGAVKELTPFDELREGYEGQGINIAVIDTGIDWAHPMFGGDPTPPRLGVAPPTPAFTSTNRKVIYHLPLTDSPVGDGFGHGTHVASTAAGYLAQHPGPDGLPNTSDDIRLHGVAPQAKLMSYTVCSSVRSTYGSVLRPQIRALNPTVGSLLPVIGGCEQADTIKAVEDAVSPFTLTGQPKPVAHVINLSLGGSGGPDTPTAVACSNAALAGSTVVASSGNSGPGEGTTGSPAAGTHVISVGATTHPGGASSLWSADVLKASAFPATQTGAVTPASGFQTAAGFGRLNLFAMTGSAGLPAGSMAQRYVYVKSPTTFPANVAGRIALVRGFGTSFFDLALRAQQAGAVALIVFDDRGAVNGVRTVIPAATISTADGETLVDALSSSDDDTVDPPSGTLSEVPIRMNPFRTDQFMGEMAGFSSRGPVRGFGQIKPDVSAPGVAVLAAMSPASTLGALAGALERTPQYMHLQGTSMAAPHTAGVAALLKQAHPGWTPDMIRTALINTATNMRDQSGAPKAEGLTADSIIAQGGGLVDTYEALHAKALIGVAGDGVNTPGILGSHSYGEVPVANSRVTSTHPVAVTVRDLSGQGGTYNLAVANNRDLQLAGIGVSLSQSSVTLPPNGSATFEVTASFDGDLLRDVMAAKTAGTSVTLERIQMQWFVTARRTDNAEHLRMPFYFRVGPSLPAVTTTETTTAKALVPAGDVGLKLAKGATYADVPFQVSDTALRLDIQVEWLEADTPVGGLPDVDYELLDPSGRVVASSGAFGGPEFVSYNVTQPGTYTHRIVGYTNAATDCTITTTFTRGAPPPTLSSVAGDFADAQGRRVDFDGAFTLSWSSNGSERGYEVERSADNANWTTIAGVGPGQTSLALADQPEGENFYRVRALYDGRIGYYVTRPGNVSSVVVSRRVKEEITSLVQASLSNVSLSNGVFQFDQTLTNKSANNYLPYVEFSVVGINSASGTVTAANADNGGDGKSAATAAVYGYSRQLGADEVFSAGETTAARTLRFNDQRNELFTIDAVVTAYRGTGGGAAAGGQAGAAGAPEAEGSTGDSLQSLTALMRLTANPLTNSITVQLVSLSR